MPTLSNKSKILIIKLKEAGFKQKEIVAKFRVSQGTISKLLKKNKKWVHVKEFQVQDVLLN